MSKASIVRGRAAAAAAPVEEAPKGRGRKAAAAAPVEAPAPKGRKAAAVKEPKEAKEPSGPRGADRRYKLLVKENPFREGTKRHGFWAVLTSHKTSGEVRSEEPLCTTAFFDSLQERNLLEYLD